MMQSEHLQTIAGTISTVIFASSNIPMLMKVAKTHDLSSYSLTYIIFNNVGNIVHWIYIALLPFGPIWFLHGFYTLSTLMMLLWYLKFQYRKS